MATQTATRPPEAKHEHLVEQHLDKARRRIRTLDITAALIGLVLGVLGFAVLMTLLDGWLEFSAGFRQFAFIAFVLAGLGYLSYALVWPLSRTVNPYYAARALEQTMPEAKNSLVNYLDLQSESIPAAFKGAVAGRAARDLKKADLDEAISARRALTLTAVLGVILLVFFGQFVSGGQQFTSLLRRAFAPFSAGGVAKKTTLTLLQPAGGDAEVPVGHPVAVTVRVEGRVPDTNDSDAIRLLFRYQPDGGYEEQRLDPGSQRDEWTTLVPDFRVRNGFWYKVLGGDDATAEHRITVRATPLVTQSEVTYRYRPYLRWADLKSLEPDLKAPRGTQVTLLARTNRAVKEGKLEFMNTGKMLPAELVAGEPNAMQFKFTIERDDEYRIWFETTDGEHNRSPLKRRIEAVADTAPIVELTQPGKDSELPVNGVLTLAGKASDDLGVTTMTLKMKLKDGPALPDKPYREGKAEQFKLIDGTYPQQLDYKDFVALDKLGKTFEPGTVIEYWLEAADACDYPGPNIGKSKVFKLTLAKPIEEKQRKQDENQAKQDQQKHNEEQDKGQKEKNQKIEQQAGDKNPDGTPKDTRTPEEKQRDQKIEDELNRIKEENERKENQAQPKDDGAKPGESKNAGKPEPKEGDPQPNPQQQPDPKTQGETKPQPQPGQQTGENKNEGKPEPGANPQQQQGNKGENKPMGDQSGPNPMNNPEQQPGAKPEGSEKNEGKQPQPGNQGENKQGPKPDQQQQAGGDKNEGKPQPMNAGDKNKGENKNQGNQQANNDPQSQPAQPKEKGAEQQANAQNGTPGQDGPSQAKEKPPDAEQKGEQKGQGTNSPQQQSSAKAEGKQEGGSAKGESRSGQGSDEQVSKGEPKGEASGGGANKEKAEGLGSKIRQAQQNKDRAANNKRNAKSNAERNAAQNEMNQADQDQQDAEEQLADMSKNAPSQAERDNAKKVLNDAKRQAQHSEVERASKDMSSPDKTDRDNAKSKLEDIAKNGKDPASQQAAKDALKQHQEPAPNQSKIDQLANQMKNGKTDKEKQQAENQLQQIADKAPNKSDREAAENALENAAKGQPAPNQDKIDDLAKKMNSGNAQEKKDAEKKLDDMKKNGASNADRQAAKKAMNDAKNEQEKSPQPAPQQDKIDELAKKLASGTDKEKKEARKELEDLLKKAQAEMDKMSEADKKAAEEAMEQAQRRQKGEPTPEQKEIEKLARELREGNEQQRQDAQDKLEQKKNDSQSPENRDQAAKALERWGGPRGQQAEAPPAIEANPEFKNKAGGLTLEKLDKVTPDMLKKLGYETPEDQAAWRKAAADYIARNRDAAGNPKLDPGTNSTLNNVGPREVKPTGTETPSIGIAPALPPPAYRDAFKEWSQRIQQEKK